MSSFSAINTALTGLLAHRKVIEVTGHNIANVNTPGFHRQEAVLQVGTPAPTAGNSIAPAGGQFGTGVDVAYVRRMQDAFMQQQIHLVEGQLGRWTMAEDALGQIEALIAPGQGLDLSSQIDKFFEAWQQLALHPEELASRMSVRSEGINLATALNETVGKLNFISTEIDISLQTRVDRVNLLADSLANLNVQIGMAKAEGRTASDLSDQRDLVLSELTTLTGAMALGIDEGTSLTNIGGRPLVAGSVVNHVALVQGPGGKQVVWASDNTAVNIRTGEIAGLYEARMTTIPAYRNQMDSLAFALSSAVNGLHTTGVTMTDGDAGDFFIGTTAGAIHVHDDIVADARNVAATRTVSAPGDGSLASEIYGLSQRALVGSQTLNQSAQSLISQIGNDVRSAQTSQAASKALKEQLDIRQQSVGGVSLDEEMTNLMTAQNAYDASARVLRTADEMLESLLDLLR